MSYIRYLGHSSFELGLEDSVIYVDPFFSEGYIKNCPRLIPPAMRASEIKNADLIFVTHEHPTHCEKETIKEIVERTYATVVAPKPALSMLAISDRFKVDVRVGDSFTVKNVDVEVVNAMHPQSAYPVGYVIKRGGKSIYHAGDTYEFSGMMDIKADYSLIPIGGVYTMDPMGAQKACRELQTRFAIPMHYDTYERIKQSPEEFAKDVGTRVKPIIMRVGAEKDI